MKEITRIHLAKTAYDIEVAAKKQLEKYVKSLELYTQDQDLLTDIEIRMTEILAERSVKMGGVISTDDVEAIRTQLGEPHEFADESGDIAVGNTSDSLENRRYYRDLDGAVLGGVLSGVGTYFGFNPLWARLGFIVLVMISWGAALLLYIVLWIAVPPARTTAERLQLTGKPVNLAAIRELNELQSTEVNKTAQGVRTFFRISFGLASAGAALLSFIVTVWGAIGLVWGTTANSPLGDIVPGSTSYSWIIYVLSVLSGMLLTLLFSVLAYAIFRRSWTKKIAIVLIGTVIAGILTSSGAVSTGLVYSWREQAMFMETVKDYKELMPASFSNIKKLSIKAGSLSYSQGETSDLIFKYVVEENGSPRYELKAPAGTKPDIVINGDTAQVSIRIPQSNQYYYTPELTIYGPVLDEFAPEHTIASYHSEKQDSLITSSTVSNVEVYGEYRKMTTLGTGDIRLDQATIEDLTINAKVGSFVGVGVVRSLTVTQPDVCPSSTGDWQSRVSVVSVSSNSITYNGKKGDVKTHKNPCSILIVGDDNLTYSQYYPQGAY